MSGFNSKPKEKGEYDKSEHASGQVNVKTPEGKAKATPKGVEIAKSGKYKLEK